MNYFSHIGQDNWVDRVLNQKRDGYFLDFGAFDGVSTSNTYFFEKFRGWRGICVEPNPYFFAAACTIRSCITVNNALWTTSRLPLDFVDAHGLSALAEFKDGDTNAASRNAATQKTIKVDTINPMELLERFNAPKYIDYMSLDIEGAEIPVLLSLDLTVYKIGLISVEHNHDVKKRNQIRSHLSRFGYEALDFRNDDLFFNRSILSHISDNGEDPNAARDAVLNVYKIRDM